MSRSIEYRLPGARRFRFGPAAAEETVGWGGPKIAFRFLIVFVLLLYSSIAVVFPALNAFRPALIVGFGGIVMMIVELALNRQSFRLSFPTSYLLFAFLGACVISSFSAFYLRAAFDTTSDFVKVALIYVLIENTVTTESRLRQVMLTMIGGGLIPAFGMIRNYLAGNLVEGSRAAWVGVFGNPNEAAYALVILVPMAMLLMRDAGWLMRAVLAGATAILLLAIFLSFSRGGLLGLFIVLGLFGWKQRFLFRVLMVGALAGGLILVGLFWTRKDNFDSIGQDTTFNQRINTIKAGIRMFADRPVFGVGPGCSIVAYQLYITKEEHCGCELMLVIHNSFIQVLSELGALGFIPWMTFFALTLLYARRMQQRDGPLQAPATGLELALWGFMACSLSGGFTYSWFPYIVAGLIVAGKRIFDESAGQPAGS